MSNRYMNQFYFSLESSKVVLFGKGIADVNGDVALTPARNSKGFDEIVHNGLGDYSIFLQDTYVRLMGINIVAQAASGASGSVPNWDGFWVASEAVNDPAQKVINVGIYDHSGNKVNFGNGTSVLFEVILSNSSAP